MVIQLLSNRRLGRAAFGCFVTFGLGSLLRPGFDPDLILIRSCFGFAGSPGPGVLIG
jgi:hypothetical protein